MNLPPQPHEADIPGHLARGLAALHRGSNLSRLLTYRYGAGSPDDRAAGVAWLRPLVPAASADSVLICPGAQAALVALLTALVRPGDVVLAEDLAYPGFRAAASHFGIQVKGVAMDAEGLRPDCLRAACREHKPKALYCVPTIHNPTTATMSLKRRRAIAAIARQHKVLIFEDDAYGLLPPAPLPPLATFAPELTFYVASLAKCVTPGLRIAYLHAPDPVYATQLGAAIRATTLMTSPLVAALVTGLIHNGTAAAIVAAIRQESALRQRLAARILPAKSFRAHPQGHHLWLEVPAGWSRAELVAYAREKGLAAVPCDPFVAAPTAASGVRIALGAAHDRGGLEEGLRLLAAALAQSPAVLSRVV
jgi:DNA-binding transcriptional MocR family regulator